MKKSKKGLLLFLGSFFFIGFLYLFLSSPARFSAFCDQLFIDELQNNALTLHYIVADPTDYGIENSQISLGSAAADPAVLKRALFKEQFLQKTIFRCRLSEKQQRLYDALAYHLSAEMERADYTLLEEPLVPSIGIQSQLPILLAEYAFRNEADVVNYLALLKCVPDYFDSIIALEEEKIPKGLFMDPATARELIVYCQEFCTAPKDHFLEATFLERISALELDPQKEKAYLTENTALLNGCVFPSYKKLQDFLEENQSQGQNSDGLYYFPEGTAYYACLLCSKVGVDHSFDEIQVMLDEALKENTAAIARLTKENPALLSERDALTLDTSNPAGLTSYLSKRIQKDFPEIPEVSLTLCQVPSSMEAHLSPAFYLVPPIDQWTKNTIYLNHGYLSQGISVFTTLAHEGYPGHLYQNVYENAQAPHPLQRLLSINGYSEGWATYAEQLSYFYAPISEDLAALLSTTRAMTLNLYSHLDLYVHAYGWTEEDCVAYLKKFGITNAAAVHEMFLLVKQQPANYLTYYLGYLEICRLKEQAETALGDHFDLKEFHEFVLSYGPAPFPLLETYLKQWIQQNEEGFSDAKIPPRCLMRKILCDLQSCRTGCQTAFRCFLIFL